MSVSPPGLTLRSTRSNHVHRSCEGRRATCLGYLGFRSDVFWDARFGEGNPRLEAGVLGCWLTRVIQAVWYGILFYNISLVFTRISILLLYKRIFTYNWAKRAIQIALVLVIVSGIWFIASVATSCVPLSAFWDWSLRTQAYCQPPALWWGNAAIHIAGDLAIVILPVRPSYNHSLS